MSTTRPMLLLLSLVGLFACASDGGSDPFGGQTGSEVDPCGHVASLELADDEQTPLGFSASDVLAFAAGSHTAAVQWPSGDQTDLTLEVSATGPARFEDVEPQAQTEGPETQVLCEDALFVPVRVTISTDDGHLADEVDAVMKSTNSDSATLFMRLSDGALVDEDSGLDPTQYDGIDYFLEAELQPAHFAGRLWAQATTLEAAGDEQSVSATNVDLLQWGPAER